MERPYKTKTTWSAFIRYTSGRNCLPDYAPPDGHEPTPLKPRETPSEKAPTKRQMIPKAPRIRGVHKPVNSLNSPPTTQRFPSFKKTPFNLHESRPQQEDFNKKQDIGAKSLSSKAFSENVIDEQEIDTLPSPKSRYADAPRSAQSQNRNVSPRNTGTKSLPGLEKFQGVQSQVDHHTHTKRSSGLPSHITTSRQHNNTPQRTSTALSICSGSEVSVSDTDLAETITTSQKPTRTYPQVIIHESTGRESLSSATARPKGIGKPSLSVKPTGSNRERKSSNNSQSGHSTESSRDRNEQIAATRTKRPFLKRKTRRSSDVIDLSEDELAHTSKQPKLITKSGLNKVQAKASKIRKSKGSTFQPLKAAGRGSGMREYQVLSIFSETHYWLQPQPLRHWALRQDHFNGELTVYDELGDPIRELVLKSQIIQKIQRSPDSEKLVIHKHKDATAKGSTKLFLELLNADDAWQICKVLEENDSTIVFVTLEETQLDRRFFHNRKLIARTCPKESQLQIESKTGIVEDQVPQINTPQERGRGLKGFKQAESSVDQRRHDERSDWQDTCAPRKRKRDENTTTPTKRGTVEELGKIRSSDTTVNNGSLASAKASSSIGPDSFYSDGFPSSPNRLSNGEPVLSQRSSQRSPSPVRWTEANQNWARAWKSPIVYPRRGGNKSLTMVEKDDIERLDEGEYLNDNLINFYLRWLEQALEEENPRLARRIYFYNTFFYKSLTQGAKGKRGINYEAVQRWTSKVDLLSFDYIVVPINEDTHWYVAIICNAPKLQGLQPGLVPSLQSLEDKDKPEDLQDSGHMVKLSDPASRSSPKSLVTTLMDKMTFKRKGSSGEQGQGNGEWPKVKDHVELQEQSRNADLCESSSSPNRVMNSTGTTASDLPIYQGDSPCLAKRKQGKTHVQRTVDPSQPRIITLDSLGLKHSPTCTNLKNYLISEIKAKKKIDIPSPGSLGMTAVNIPRQTNYVDCGAFLLTYVEQFLKQPDEFVYSIMQSHDLQIEFQTASIMRDHIRQLLLKLQQDQIDEAEALVEEQLINKQPRTADNRLGRSTKVSIDDQTSARTDQILADGHNPPGELCQALHNIGRSAVDTVAECKQPNGSECSAVVALDVKNISYTGPVSHCKSNAGINTSVHASRADKRHLSLRSESSPDSVEVLDTREKSRNSRATFLASDLTPSHGRQLSGSSVEVCKDHGFQDTVGKPKSRINAINDDFVIVIDS